MSKLFTIEAKQLKRALDTLSKSSGAKVGHINTESGIASVTAFGTGADCVCIPFKSAEDIGTGAAVFDLSTAKRVLKGLPGSVTVSVEAGPCGPVTLLATPFPADVTARGKIGETRPVRSVPPFVTSTDMPKLTVSGSELLHAAALVDCCIDTYQSRYALGSLCLDASRKRIAATDSKRLAWCPLSVEATADFPEVCLIPPAICAAVSKAATVIVTEINPARFILSDGSLFACFENPGRFPKYYQIIDDNSKLNLAGTVRGDRLFHAVDSADCSLSSEGDRRIVDLVANSSLEVKNGKDRKAALPWLNSGRHKEFSALLDGGLLAPWLRSFKKSGTVEVYAPASTGAPLRFACGAAQLIIMPIER